jgi:uncharacterized protein (DUF1501 family)
MTSRRINGRTHVFGRRDFVRGGITAFSLGFAAPRFLSDIALAQGASVRNLVVLYLGGGNDSLSMLVPYRDPSYQSRRPTLAIPAGQVLQIGSDRAGNELGLHPRLAGLRSMFNEGRVALIQRTGYANSSRSHFEGTDIWSTANPISTQGPGWLGRYLDTIPPPVDPLFGWNTGTELPHSLLSRLVAVPSITAPSSYAFNSPNGAAEAALERAAAARMSSHLPLHRPHLAFVNASVQSALATLDRVASAGDYVPSVNYPNNGFGMALRGVASALAAQIGTRIFWVQTGGYDTHAAQSGSYANLMTTLNDGLYAFYRDLGNLGLLNDTLILQFSEFGRRVAENGSGGTDHGAASVMMAIGGGLRGGIYGTAPSLSPDPANPTLENNAADVRFETDFRSVYARVIDRWLGGDSAAILGGDFRGGHDFI